MIYYDAMHADRGDLFEGLAVWRDEKIQADTGNVSCDILSFADKLNN